MIVADASVVIAALVAQRELGDKARARLLSAESIHAPHLLDAEVLSVLRRMARRGELSEHRVLPAIDDLLALGVERYPHYAFLFRTWQLRGNLTPYDALYVALAESLGCSFVTADARIAKTPGLRCEVELLCA